MHLARIMKIPQSTSGQPHYRDMLVAVALGAQVVGPA